MSNKIAYIDYSTLEEFYTIAQTCSLLQVEKNDLREKCRQYGVEPRQNEIGDYGFVKYDVRKLHNKLYHECSGKAVDDPWA